MNVISLMNLYKSRVARNHFTSKGRQMATMTPPRQLTSIVSERSLRYEPAIKAIVAICNKRHKSSREFQIYNLVSEFCAENKTTLRVSVKFGRVLSRNVARIQGVIEMIEQDTRTTDERLLVAALLTGSYLQ